MFLASVATFSVAFVADSLPISIFQIRHLHRVELAYVDLLQGNGGALTAAQSASPPSTVMAAFAASNFVAADVVWDVPVVATAVAFGAAVAGRRGRLRSRGWRSSSPSPPPHAAASNARPAAIPHNR